VLKFATQVIVMEQGKIIAQTSPQSLFYGHQQSESFIKPPLVQLIEKLRKKGKKITSKQERSLTDFIQGWKGHS
jgi:energy-coupling factor transporter ATP-binding protein EcfA2